MSTYKRSSYSSKGGKFNNNVRDIILSPTDKPEAVADIKDFSNVPIIKQVENARSLPKYTSLLCRGDRTIAMDDLDLLQQDLEKLMCINASRTKFFLGEYTRTNQKEPNNAKKGRHKTSLKRKRTDIKGTDRSDGGHVLKKDPSRFYNETVYQEIPKISTPKSYNSDKFWASLEPYCAPINKDDIAFLDTLIQELSKEIDRKIPEIGEHYATSWSEETIIDEQNSGKFPSKKTASIDFKKNDLFSLVESFGKQFCQKLACENPALNVFKKSTENGNRLDKLKELDLSKLKHNNVQKVGACLEKRLLKNLIEHGILREDEISKDSPEDEILTEIQACEKELIAVNEYNTEELNKMKAAVMNDVHCNQLKDDLDKIDKEVLDLYNNIMVTRKKALQEEGKHYDKIFSQSSVNEFERKANALLRQQHVLNREINSSRDMAMLY